MASGVSLSEPEPGLRSDPIFRDSSSRAAGSLLATAPSLHDYTLVKPEHQCHCPLSPAPAPLYLCCPKTLNTWFIIERSI